jgi:hypothetical protein
MWLLQLVVVVTSGWSAPRGVLTRWEMNGAWRQVGAPVEVALGENGLGWGRGLKPSGPGPKKLEGDHRSPAGMFLVGRIYDRADAVCVDDPDSRDYNRIVNEPASPGRAHAPRGEDMRMYRRAIVVGHNQPAKRGAGSCIFLHDGDSPTVGCTAMAPAALDELAAWLKKGAVLVQLPKEAYRQVKRRWKLPDAEMVGDGNRRQ